MYWLGWGVSCCFGGGGGGDYLCDWFCCVDGFEFFEY